MIATINPATGETLRTFSSLSRDELDQKISAAADAFRGFRRTTPGKRREWMNRAAGILEARKREFGDLITMEMGKPITASIAEVVKCASACRYYAENAERLLADEKVPTSATESFVTFQPMGVILAVMPWNFPFWQVFRFAAPTLMAGNVGLLKHASNVPQCALAIQEIFSEAGFPDRVFQTLLIGSDMVKDVLRDPRVAAATLTGSEAAGRDVAGTAGREIKKTVLELGGSDPFIVMPSANLDDAAKTAVKARTVNSGQSCIAAKRFIVAEEVADEFERRFVSGMKSLKVGDPTDEATEIGPLATPQILEDVAKQVVDSVNAGARLLTGGRRIGSKGTFYEPTVLTHTPLDSPASREEVFGPVAAIFRVRDINEAIRIANDSTFGLGASVWTNDDSERRRFVSDIETGQVFVNAMVASDPHLPFGGVKRSGYGRELGAYGIREFMNIKTVWINDGSRAAKKETE